MIGRLPVLQEYELCFDISMIFQTMIVTNTVARSIKITRVALVWKLSMRNFKDTGMLNEWLEQNKHGGNDCSLTVGLSTIIQPICTWPWNYTKLL